MSARRPPLFNLIIVALMCSAAVVILPAAILIELSEQQPPHAPMSVVEILLLIVFWLMSAAGLWLTIRLLTGRRGEQMADDQRIPRVNPPFSEQTKYYRFDGGFHNETVFIDPVTRRIGFHRCFTPRSLLAVAQHWHLCSFDELQAVFEQTYRVNALTIVTKTGKAWIGDQGAQSSGAPATIQPLTFSELGRAVAAAIPPNAEAADITEHPMMGYTWIIGSLLGMGCGVLLAPADSNEASFSLFFLGGAISGAAGLYLFIRALHRLMSVNLASPIGYSAVGLSSGLTFGAIFASVFDHDFLVLLCSATIGLAGGFLYGMLIIPRKHTGEETSIDTPDSAPQVDQH